MTIQTFTPAELATVPPAPPDGVAQIVRWAETANAAASLVERLVDTPFMPAVFWPKQTTTRETPEEYGARRAVAVASGTAAVLYGGEIGLTPLSALSSVVVVKGKPSLYAEVMVALVRAAGHDVRVDELTDRRCIMRGRRRGANEYSAPVEFSIERAQRAGYVQQNAKYKSDPQAMLYARCASILCRQIAPEVLRGLPTVEDMQDEPDPTAAPPATRTVQRAPRQAPAALPPAPEPAATAPAWSAPQPSTQPSEDSPAPTHAGPPLPGEEEQQQADQGPETVTDPQLKKLGAVLGGHLGIGGPGSRDERLRIVSSLVKRPLTSSKDLTKAEARTVIDTLEGTTKTKLYEVIGEPPARGTAAAPADDEPHASTQDEIEAEADDLTAEEPPIDPWGINP